MVHEIKLRKEFCDDVLSGKKSFEIRNNDRGYKVEDLVLFIPIDEEGNAIDHDILEHIFMITYVLENEEFLPEGYVAFSIKDMKKTRADEGAMMFANSDQELNDRKLFVHNLGELLSQTRDGVVSCELDDNEIVTITYHGGGTRQVNIFMDSYGSIVRDVANRFQ